MLDKTYDLQLKIIGIRYTSTLPQSKTQRKLPKQEPSHTYIIHQQKSLSRLHLKKIHLSRQPCARRSRYTNDRIYIYTHIHTHTRAHVRRGSVHSPRRRRRRYIRR